MPVTLRKRLQCHYCGKRLNTARKEGSKIKCDGCLADNFFDSDDNFTDVPVEEVRRAGSQAPLAEIASESDIFCTTCLKNQYLYTAALSEYLPDEDDPNYEAIENALPEYQKQLDLRYPRCCRRCEPRVQAQLKRANYAAKSDHLQRKMQRDRNMRRTPAQYVRSWLIATAGLGNMSGLLAQLFWHLLSSQANTDLIMVGITPRQCLCQYPIPSQCTEYAATWVPYALFAGLFCFWWNPKWQHRLEGREGRLIGLSRYYKIQMVLLGLRFAAWAILRDLPGIDQYAAPLHTMVFLTFLATSLYLYLGIVKVDKTPIVDWNQAQAPLVNPDQYEAPDTQQYAFPASSQSKRGLPVEALANTSRSLPYDTWQPPTPPLEEDSMDWAPAGQTFTPRPRVQKPKIEQKSPFYGTLPAKPVRGSLNPRAPQAPAQRPAIGLPPGFFGLTKSRVQEDADSPQRHIKEVFAAPKFFASERQSDTGLEALFDTVFSVKDTREMKPSTPHRKAASTGLFDLPNKIKSNSPNSNASSQPRNPPVIAVLISCVIIIGIVVLATNLIPNASDTGEFNSPRKIVPYLTIVPMLHGLSDLACQGQIAASSLISGTFELAFIIAGYIALPKLDSAYAPICNKFIAGVIGLCFIREVYRLFQFQSSPPIMSTAVREHMEHNLQRTESEEIEPEDSEPTPIPPTHVMPVPYDVPPLPQTPMQSRRSQFTSNYTSLRNRDSDESISTTASAHTTSTASGWKTPQNPRTSEWQSHRGTPSESGLISRGIGGLTLSNDFGMGSSIARPRDRTNTGQSGPFNRYR